MASLPTTQRDQAKLLVGILGIVGAVAYWNFLYTPKALELQESRAAVEALETANTRARAAVARGSVSEIRAEADQMVQSLEVIRTLIPTGSEVPALLDQINVAGRRVGLEFSNFQPGGTTTGAQFDTYRFRMSVRGTFHEITALLTAIGGLPRIIVPTNVTLVEAPPRPSRTGEPDDPSRRELNATFDIETYVAHLDTTGGGR